MDDSIWAGVRERVPSLIAAPAGDRVLGAIGHKFPSPDAAAQPLLGLRMPDLDLDLGDGEWVRFSDLTRIGRGVLLNLTDVPLAAAAPWSDRVTHVRARAESGSTDAEAILVRPDGYVCWAGGTGLTETPTRWFGPADLVDDGTVGESG